MILVTGCAGLFGANFTRFLLDRGYEVVGIDNLFGGYEDFLPIDSRFTFYNQDLLDSEGLSKIFNTHNIECVFHFAAYAAEGLSPFIRRFNYQNNVICSINVINECIKHQCKIVFTSSMAVYGDQPVPFVENMDPSPIDPYGIAKLTVEMDIKQASSQFGLRYTIVRPHNVLGIYQNIWDKYRNVIGIFIRSVLTGSDMLIYGDGSQTRAFSDIKYLMPSMEKFITQYDGEIFNLGSDREFTINEIAQKVFTISKSLGYSPNCRMVDYRHEAKHAYCSHVKANEEIGFRDETDIDQVIRDMFLWAKNQPEREVKKIPYEVDNSMYSYWK